MTDISKEDITYQLGKLEGKLIQKKDSCSSAEEEDALALAAKIISRGRK